MAGNLFGENTFKANILESLTTGMYHDSKVIYREYIQNACDSIDLATRTGVLNSAGEGTIEIWVDSPNRSVIIEDNGAGLSESEFAEFLTTIGGSQKQLDVDKGFRGMGRLCGLGYCSTLVFLSSAKGESIESVMTCDAVTMRGMINEHNTHSKDYTAIEVLEATTSITTNHTDNKDSHFFRVELIGISASNKDLLDKEAVENYLSFIAPVPYRNTFTPRYKIYKYAKALNLAFDEYNLKFEGKQIFKEYKPTVITSKGEDTISDVDFFSFWDDNDKLIAWLWFGITKFQAVLKKENLGRGIRLRKENIQIGNEDALQKLFMEDRGQHYFVGEVFAVDKELIPNSQRDYFNENNARIKFEQLLRSYFNGTLSKIYKDGSTVNAAIADINRANKIAEQIADAQAKGVQINQRVQEQYENATQKANRKQKDLAKITEQVTNKINSGDFQPADVIIHSIIEQVTQPLLHTSVTESSKTVSEPYTPANEPKPAPVHELMKPPRMISFDKVKDIIIRNISTDLANLLISRIEEEIE